MYAGRYAVIDTTPLVIEALKRRSGCVAGPRSTLPLAGLKRDPWHGHWNTLSVKPLIVHCWCVHVAV